MNEVAESGFESVIHSGTSVGGGGGEGMVEGAEGVFEIDVRNDYSPYRDLATATLGSLARTRDSIHKTFQATDRRAKAVAELTSGMLLSQCATELGEIQKRIDRALVKALHAHVLWGWLDAHRVRGVHVARFISMIRNPHLYPGRKCTIGHYLPADWVDACPVLCGEKGEKPTVCKASVGPVRRGTGTRALWHYFGLHVVDGRSPRMRKGQQCTWNPIGRSCLLQPGGIVEQIVRHRQEPWRSTYDEAKKRLQLERGAGDVLEIETAHGVAFEEGSAAMADEIDARTGIAVAGGAVDPLDEIAGHCGTLRPTEVEGNADDRDEIAPDYDIAASGGAAESLSEIDARSSSLRPFQIEERARKIAVKAFAADLLSAWKELDPVRGAGNVA